MIIHFSGSKVVAAAGQYSGLEGGKKFPFLRGSPDVTNAKVSWPSARGKKCPFLIDCVRAEGRDCKHRTTGGSPAPAVNNYLSHTGAGLPTIAAGSRRLTAQSNTFCPILEKMLSRFQICYKF